MKLPHEAAAAAYSGAATPGNSRPSSATSSKSSKASLFLMYPHMYAVELRKPAWLRQMIACAEACFLEDAKRDPMLKRNQRSEAEMSRRVASAAAKKKVEWINEQIGANNPPTALFRSVCVAV